MDKLLPSIKSPADLQGLSLAQLKQLATEIREEICTVVERRSAHFASNLGVVELTLALYTTFDFPKDRLIWDVGHQSYPHKLVTGRYDRFETIRTKGGLMGYPNPAESPFDLFMTGHAGVSVSSALGLKCGDDLMAEIQGAACENPNRNVVAVIGDGSFSNGVVFEGLNHLGELQKNVTIILNDNKMSICPRVGSFGRYLDTLRLSPGYTELKEDMKRAFECIPLVGRPMRHFMHHQKMAFKAAFLGGGMLFEEFGIRYIGPIDGHDIRQLQKFLRMAQRYKCPVLLHVLTQKGHGYEPAEADPSHFHAPQPLLQSRAEAKRKAKLVAKKLEVEHLEAELAAQPEDTQKAAQAAEAVEAVELLEQAAPKKVDHSYTVIASRKIQQLMEQDPRVVVITAAMCQGNKLEQIREKFPKRFFDVGICEAHAVTLAAGMAKAGLRPIVDIYSTFMQRAYDHLFHEVSLQNLPVTLLMDRAGLVGADGPTHHGMYDLTYLRPLPHMVVAAPVDALDLEQMLELAVTSGGPFAIRYPKTQTAEFDGLARTPVQLGKSEVLLPGQAGGGLVLACGAQVADALAALRQLKLEKTTALVNVRFVKPLDTDTLFPLVRQCRWLLTLEEGARMGGFGSAVLEALVDAGIALPKLRRLGVGDVFIQHASRAEQLDEAGLSLEKITQAIKELNR